MGRKQCLIMGSEGDGRGVLCHATEWVVGGVGAAYEQVWLIIEGIGCRSNDAIIAPPRLFGLFFPSGAIKPRRRHRERPDAVQPLQKIPKMGGPFGTSGGYLGMLAPALSHRLFGLPG